MNSDKRSTKPLAQESKKNLNMGESVVSVSLKNEQHSWWEYLVPPFVLSIITSLVYFPSLPYPFQFDDLANITKKFEIRFFDWQDHFFRYSRWVGEVLNRLNYRFGEACKIGGGGFDPFYYRVINVGIHIFTGVLLFGLIHSLFSRLEDDSFLKKHALSIASIASGLFLLHPVQTQTVSYVIQGRLEGMAALFILAVLWLVVTALQTSSSLVYWLSYAGAVFLAFASCGSKEIVIVLPFLTVLVDLFFIARGNVKQVLKRSLFHLVIGVVVVLTLIKYIQPDFFMKIIGLKTTVANNRGNILNGGYSQLITPWHYFVSEFKVILHYLAIFFFPVGLSVEYDWKMVKSLFALDCMLPGLTLIALVLSAVWYWWRHPKSIYVFSLAWFLIGVAPRSTFMPSPELICDYKTYLASIGVFLWMAVVLVHVYEWACAYDFFSLVPSTRRLQTAGFGMLCAFGLCVVTYQRNLVWATSVSFWLDIVEKAPNKARAQNNLGVALSESGRFEEAVPYFLKAIMLDKQYSDPFSNAAVCYSVKGDDSRAIHCLKEAVKLNPEYAEAQNNLGSLLIKQGDHVAAEACLKNALILRPYYGKAWFNLGRLYLEQKKNEDAWTAFVKATQGDLDGSHAFDILGQIGLQIGKYEQAVVAFEESMKRSNGSYLPQTQFNLANGYFLTNRLADARKIFHELFEKHPAELRFGYNLAETMFMQGEFATAYPIFRKIADESDILPNAPMRAAQCLEKSGDIMTAFKYVEQVLATTKSEQVATILKSEKNRMSFAAHLKESGGVVTAQDLQKFLGNAPVQQEVAA